MTSPACLVVGCKRPHLARGMCSSHYATWHRKQFGRHDKVFGGTCGWCGHEFRSPSHRTRACCHEHGLWLGGRVKLVCDVPSSHPIRSTSVPTDHPSLAPLGVAPAWPVWYGDCDECGQVFSSNTPVKRYCSKLCSRRVSKRARRGREAGDGDSFRWTQVIALFLALDRCCAYCWQPIEGQPDPDHVIPLSRGGHNTISNVLPACRPCNTDKRNLTPDEWAQDRARRGKPPRVTTWESDPRYTHLALRTAVPLPVAA